MKQSISKEIEQNIIEVSNTAFFVINSKVDIVFANPACELLLQLSARRLCKKKLSELASLIDLNTDHILDLLTNETSFTDNEVTLLIANKFLLVSLSATYLNFNDEKHVVIELRDMEQQKKLSMVHYQKHQQKAAQDLVRGLAHEIKNPLAGLRGAAQLLENELIDLDLHEFTQIIIEQADRLSSLVDRLLGPKLMGDKSKHNLHHVLEKVRQLVSINLDPSIKISLDYDPSIPDFFMQKDQIEQALLNIVQNAVQALIEGGDIIIKTRTAHQITINGEPQKLVAEIKIIDNGPGIPEEIKDTIFYPMVTGRFDGTGLGLSIAQELIKQHNGRIECKSAKGDTVFLIYLPIITTQEK